MGLKRCSLTLRWFVFLNDFFVFVFASEGLGQGLAMNRASWGASTFTPSGHLICPDQTHL